MKTLAMIQARGVSTRLPNKNIIEFFGNPMVAYPIIAAQGSRIFDEIMVSTDSKDIAEVARSYGANVPFLRSPENSTADSDASAAAYEVLRRYEMDFGQTFDVFALIHGCDPFTTVEMLSVANDWMESTDFECIKPVYRIPPIEWAFRRAATHELTPVFPSDARVQSWAAEAAWMPSGQFYTIRTAAFMRSRSLLGLKTAGIMVKENQRHDIDAIEDLEFAKQKWAFMHEQPDDDRQVIELMTRDGRPVELRV